MILVVTVIVAIAGYHYYGQPANPYPKAVLSLAGDASRGAALFQLNCSACHGIKGIGEVGPSLVHIGDRRTRLSLIEQVTSGQTPPMPQFQPDPQAMADLLAYLQSL
ncbi:MAG: c-type cytochrome [Cyanobacteria bacterium REEB459]|nr:c-type cytochrome [Cyanobacteria bacterium REEB459]